MKRLQIIGLSAAILFLIVALAPSVSALLQRPTPTVVGGATSGGILAAFLIDSDGTIHTTATPIAGTAAGISPNPAFVTTYAGTAGLTTITSGSTTLFSSTTTDVTNAYCANITGSAVTINLTDGAGNYFLKNFSLAANSALPAGWAYNTIWTTGIKASANTASAVNCQFNGFQ